MRAHDVMQTRSGWLEAAAGFRIIITGDKAHELGHGVAVVPWRTESVLLHQPTWWEDDKVGDGSSDMVRGASEDSENGRIGVIKGNRADGVKAT